MAVSDRDRKLLWAKSGNRCAFPGCRRELTEDAKGGDTSFPLGVEAHIVGRKRTSPRGEHPLPLEDRDRYENLILLDPTHHTVIDNDVKTYTVERLHEIKRDHERWVHETLGPEAPPELSLAKLPVTDPDLFGRQEELKVLNQAWEDPHTHILAFIAFGGVGKSAIVNHWLRQMETADFRGARRVFGWSFYSQGTSERTVSADQFIHSALAFFGDPNPNEGSPWDKGQRLAQLIRQQPTLLILDGLEPLQWGPGPQEGEFKDRAGSMYPLLRELSHGMDGLCVLSSRLNITDIPLSDTSGPARRINLERLSTKAGRALLRAYGVKKGLDPELDAAVQEYEGHALALCLLAEYLVEFLDADIAKRDLIPPFPDRTRAGRHAFRVMHAYDIALAKDGMESERAILRIIGLFDRPADKGCLDALRQPPAIPGVTDSIVSLTHRQWREAVGMLRQLRLLSPSPDPDDSSLDAHPLVREWFGLRLEDESAEGFRKAHGRLYEYLRGAAEQLPDTLEEMHPLYQAVHHGCKAKRHEETFHEVFLPRMRRSNLQYTLRRLGAVGADLGALAGFFDEFWSTPVVGLSPRLRAFVLNDVGYNLRALGRLREAIAPQAAAFQADARSRDWINAATSGGNLSFLYRAIGELSNADRYAARSVQSADRSAIPLISCPARAFHAAVLHRRGRLSAASALCRRFRSMAREIRPRFRHQFALASAEVSACQLDLGDWAGVRLRSQQFFSHSTNNDPILTIGLYCLLQGQSFHHAAFGSSDSGTRSTTSPAWEALPHLAKAVDQVRLGGRRDRLPEPLLARASFHRDFSDHNQAHRDLKEALDLSTRIGLRLHETDARLLQGHMALDEDSPDIDTAAAALGRAAELVTETGYHLRDADLLILKGRLLAKQGDKNAGSAKLQEAVRVARREPDAVYQLAIDQAERYLRELDASG